MIVCICRAKTDRDVLRAIEEGAAASLRDLQSCGIGTDCGTCHSMLRAMVETAAEEPAAACPRPVLAPATFATSA